MSKELVLQVLSEAYQHQVRTNAGGIVGGKEQELFAQQDEERYLKALNWYKKNIIKQPKP